MMEDGRNEHARARPYMSGRSSDSEPETPNLVRLCRFHLTAPIVFPAQYSRWLACSWLRRRLEDVGVQVEYEYIQISRSSPRRIASTILPQPEAS